MSNLLKKRLNIINKGKDNNIYLPKNKCDGILIITGNNNFVHYLDENNKLSLNIKVRGNNNKIVVGKDFHKLPISSLENTIEHNVFSLSMDIYGDNNEFSIGTNVDGILKICIEGGAFKVNDCSLRIGNNTHIGHPTKMIFEENNTQIDIGDDCMFSENVEFWCSDTHSVLDRNTNVVLNKGYDIRIGNYVWVARDVHFNKNTAIANNSIVGHHSIVTKKFIEPNIIIAGNPAKKCKSNISWNWFRPDLYEIRNNIRLVNKDL